MKVIRTILAAVMALSVLVIVPAVTPKTAQAASALVITFNPPVLTAGVASELMQDGTPLQIIVTDASGNPVDLTRASDGSTIEKNTVWNNCFIDPHPDNTSLYGYSATLPQYYWTRTDLHNDDGSASCNRKLFGKDLIEIDFSQASNGVYTFRGFVANDEGDLLLKVITPDRRTAGSVRIPVKLPQVTYSIKNMDDPDGRVFETPGDPDFIMTACDNRIYNIVVTCYDANGRIIKGVTEGVSLCGGVKRTARFTPFVTRPANYEWATKPTQNWSQSVYSNGTCYYLLDTGARYDLHIGLDLNNNGKLEWNNKELFRFGSQYVCDVTNTRWTSYYTYYNTVNFMYSDGTFDENPFFDLPPTEHGGWGLGSIYNKPYFDGWIFANFDENSRIDYRDSLNLDLKGQTSFYLFAEDACNVGGLVGNSVLGDYDVAGRPPSDKYSPKKLTTRYRGDGVYFLDFDAVPQTLARISPPSIRFLWAETREEIGKQYLKPENYDLVYSVPNHIIAVVSPADSRDLPVASEGEVGLVGNQHEAAIYGRLEYNQQYNDTETTIHFTPTGTGYETIEVRWHNKNKWFASEVSGGSQYYDYQKLMWMDVYKGLEIEIEWDKQPEVGQQSTATLTCSVLGTSEPVSEATIKMKGAGLEATSITNSKGVVKMACSFTQEGVVDVLADKEGFKEGTTTFRVTRDQAPPLLELDKLPEITKDTTVYVSGKTDPDCYVMVGGQTVPVDPTGRFKSLVKLVYGKNEIRVVSTDASGNKTEKYATIEMDNVPPEIMIDDIPEIVDQIDVKIKGRVEPGSKVMINQVDALVINDLFQAEIPVQVGKNTVTIIAMDKVGNVSQKTFEVINWHKTTIAMLVGNKTMIVDESITELQEAPYISGGRTMVPIRAISEAFKAKVEWLPEDKSVSITMEDGRGKIFILMRIGSKTAFVNQEPVALDVPPEIKNGKTFVPLRFIAENFGAEVVYKAEDKSIAITRKSY
ncbi:MAG: copper amine oxidase N-terminal domain-containing protein [Caldisericia bacterium]|nr:copper amine oxidase N-terminal domain-containing protein [Caldisericia bacterium]